MSAKKRRQYGDGGLYQRGDGRWVGVIEAGWTREGTRRRITVTGKTEAIVRSKLKERKRDIARGQTAETRRRVTVKAWARQWQQITVNGVRPNTATTDDAAVKWIVETIGNRDLSSLSPADVRSVRTAITDSGLSTSTALRYHSVLMRMLKAARQEGYEVKDAALSTRPPKAAANDRTRMPVLDAVNVLGVASTVPQTSRWLAALLQGMRQAEALGLPWDEVDLNAETLTVAWQLQPLPYRIKRDISSGFVVPDGYEARRLAGRMHLVRPKTPSAWRVIPLTPWMVETLTAWRDAAAPNRYGLVWGSVDGRWADENEDRDEWYALQATAGVCHPSGRFYTLHEARHTCASLLLELGVPEPVRVQIMGHSTIASTRQYEHIDTTLARAALGQLESALRG